MVSSPEASAVGELPGAAVVERGAGGERVERRRPELGGDGVRRVASAGVPAQAGPYKRADAHREPRDPGGAGCSQPQTQAAAARGLAHRRRQPRRLRGALLAVAVGVPLRREAPVADDPAPRAPRRGQRWWGRGGRILLPADDPGEPGGPAPPLPVAAAALAPLLLLRSVAEERGEHGEPAAAAPPEPDVALLEPTGSPAAAAVRGAHLRRPEEEQRPPPRAARRRVGLAAGHVRRHRPREHQLGLRLLRVRWRRQRGRLVLRGGEREQAVAEARRADAGADPVRVPGAPHGHCSALAGATPAIYLS